MSQSARPVHVGRDVVLYPAAGEPLECVTVWLWNTTPLSARLLLAAHEWERVRSTELFDSNDLNLPTDFSAVDSVLLDLEAADVSLPTDAPTIKQRFADPDSPLRSTDVWTVIRVRDHESTGVVATDSEDTLTTNGPAADAPRVSDVGITIQQSRSTATPEESTPASGTGIGPSDWDDLTEPLSHVAAGLTGENRPFEASEDGTSLSLSATVDHATWEVIIEDTTNFDESGDGECDRPGDAEIEGTCRIRSIYPDRLGETRRAALEAGLDAYTKTLNRGGFVVESTPKATTSEQRATVEFWTPFDPQTESTNDALTENVTALAEWFDRLAA